MTEWVDRFWSKVKKTDGCWEWKGAQSSNGYGVFYLPTLGKIRHAHRVAYLLSEGVLPDSKVDVCHHCDNRSCVNPQHLFLGTRKDNMRDCAEKGRQPNKKLTPPLVREVRRIRAEGASLKTLADLFGVSLACIHNVVTKQTWGHVK